LTNKKESLMNSAELFAPIEALHLEPIKAKLMHTESGEGWSSAYADAVEYEYRRFLYLVKKFPNEAVAPLFDVDVFWHYHILDTMKYAADCEHIFGYFLHHAPDSGLRSEDDEAVHNRSGARMEELYEATFGEACIRHQEGHTLTTWAPSASAQTAWCQPASPKIAWCQPASPKIAWCQPATAKTAWCQPSTAKTAWCQPSTAITARPQSAAPNMS
jgi:hypothetical protein